MDQDSSEKEGFEKVSEYYCPNCERKHTDREWDRVRGLVNQESLESYGVNKRS